MEPDTSEFLDEPVSYVDAVQALVETGVPKKKQFARWQSVLTFPAGMYIIL